MKGVRNPGRDEIHDDGDRIRYGKKFWEGENLHSRLDLWEGDTNKCPGATVCEHPCNQA